MLISLKQGVIYVWRLWLALGEAQLQIKVDISDSLCGSKCLHLLCVYEPDIIDYIKFW